MSVFCCTGASLSLFNGTFLEDPDQNFFSIIWTVFSLTANLICHYGPNVCTSVSLNYDNVCQPQSYNDEEIY